MDKGYREFDRDTLKLAGEHGIRVYKGAGKLVNCNDGSPRVMGFFCDVEKLLKIACGGDRELWTGVYVHESCHMDQYLEKTSYWCKVTVADYMRYSGLLQGRVYPQSDIDDSMSRIVMMEAECEHRALEKIKKYDLDIDPDKYAQLANSYLYFHSAIAKYKKWYKPNRTPYTLGIIWHEMPKVIMEPEFYRIGNPDIDPDIFLPCLQ